MNAYKYMHYNQLLVIFISIFCGCICWAQGQAPSAQPEILKVENPNFDSTSLISDIKRDIQTLSSWVDTLKIKMGAYNEIEVNIKDIVVSLRKKNSEPFVAVTLEIEVLDSINRNKSYLGKVDGVTLYKLERAKHSLQGVDRIPRRERLDNPIGNLERLSGDIKKDIQGYEEMAEEALGAIKKLESAKEQAELLEKRLLTEIAREDFKKITSGSYGLAVPVKIGADLASHPGSGDDADFLTPGFSVGYQAPLTRKWRLVYDVKLRIQPAITLNDTAAIFNRILTSGADGVLQFSVNKKYLWGNLGLYAGPWFAINWLKSKVPSDSNLPGFSFISGGGDLGLNVGPTAVGFQMEYHDVTGDTLGSLASKLLRTLSTKLLVTLDTNLCQLQFRYVMASPKIKHTPWRPWELERNRRSNNQNLAIQAGFSFFPFK